MSNQQIETLESALVVIWAGGWRFMLVGLSFMEVIQGLSVTILTLITAGYTLYKWRRDVLKDKQTENKQVVSHDPEQTA